MKDQKPVPPSLAEFAIGERAELLATIARYETTAENCDLLRATVNEQAREIERLQLTCNDLDDQNERIYAELAAMKAKHNVDFVRRARTVAANIEAHESELDRYAVSLEYM